MANINEQLQKMLSARYGRDMRQAIHDSINAINNKVELYDNTEIKKQVEELQNSMISEEQLDGKINELLAENGCVTKNISHIGTAIAVLDDVEETVKNGVTYSVKDDEYKFNGTSTGGIYIWSKLFPKGTYTFCVEGEFESSQQNIVVGKADSTSGSASYVFNLPYIAYAKYKTVTFDTDVYLRFAIYTEKTVDCNFRLWAVEGDSPLPYDRSYSIDVLDVKEESLPDSVKEVVESKVEFISISDFNTCGKDMMNSKNINVLY